LYGTVFLFSFHNKEYTVRGDSLGYLSLAKNIREHQVFSINEAPPLAPELFRLPGYPFFLALINVTNPNHIHFAIAIQCLLGIALLFISWPIFMRLGGKRGAMVGASILTLDLITLLHAPVLLAEMLLQLFLVLGLVRTVRWMEDKFTRDLILAALCWGVAGLIKPIALFIPLIISLVHILDFKKAFLFGALALLLPASWAMRNSRLVGRPVYTIQGGYALLLYPAANAYAMAEHMDINTATEVLEHRIHEAHPTLEKESFEESKVYNDEAKLIMKAYPFYTLQYCAAGALRILGGTGIDMALELFHQSETDVVQSGKARVAIAGSGTLALLKRYPALIPVQMAYMLFLLASYVLFFKGGVELFFNGEKKLALILTIPFFILIAIAAHQGYYRFRLPLMPFVAFGAACFQNSFKKKENFFPLD
jgi:hypothetical protein